MIHSSHWHFTDSAPNVSGHVCWSCPGLHPGMWSLVISTSVLSGTARHPFWRVQTSSFTEGASAWICLVVSMWLGRTLSISIGDNLPRLTTHCPTLGSGCTFSPILDFLPFRHLVHKGSSLSVPSYPAFGRQEPIQAGFCPCCMALGACCPLLGPYGAPGGLAPKCRPLRTVTQLPLGLIAPPPAQWAELDTSWQQGSLVWL